MEEFGVLVIRQFKHFVVESCPATLPDEGFEFIWEFVLLLGIPRIWYSQRDDWHVYAVE